MAFFILSRLCNNLHVHRLNAPFGQITGSCAHVNRSITIWTGVETGNLDAMLNADLEEFITAFLMGVSRNVSDDE
jgi:hypothetical protein